VNTRQSLRIPSDITEWEFGAGDDQSKDDVDGEDEDREGRRQVRDEERRVEQTTCVCCTPQRAPETHEGGGPADRAGEGQARAAQ